MEVTRNDDKQFAPNPEVKLHFLDYWRIIRIRKTVILAVFLLVALTTTVVTFILPETFASFVRISISNDATDARTGLDDQRSGGLMYDPYRMQTEFQRIQSRPVLERVVEVLNLQEEWARKFKSPTPLTKEQAYSALKSSIQVRQSHNSTLVEIYAYSDTKEEAAKLANAVADVYRQVRKDARDKVTEGGIAMLVKELDKRDLVISNAQATVNKLRRELNIADYDAGGMNPTPTLDQETLRKIDSQLLEAQRGYLVASNLYSEFISLSRDELKRTAPLTTGDNHLSELISQENAAVIRRANLIGSGLGPEHLEMKAVNEMLKSIQEKLDDRLAGIITATKSRMDTEKKTMEAYAKQRADALQADLVNFATTRPYYEAKEELAKLKLLRDRLQVTIEAQKIELGTPRMGAVEIIDPAVPIAKPERPKKALNIGLGVAFGLILGIGLAFFIEYLDTSVKTIDDVERALQAPVLGVIPQNVGLLITEGPESPHGEAYRVLRTNVLFSRKDPKLNTLSIVSGGAGEGKSTTIFNLATVFAQNGQRVLVVDSDLRRPSLHRFLKISNAIGLTDYLMRRNTLEEVIQTTSMPTLDFLPSGKLPSSSLGILSSPQMKELIRDVKRRYDFVFFDSPPIMGVSDASVLASEVDMVLQVIQYRRYPQPMTIRAKQMIEKVGGNLLGIVLNNINMSQDENYYYYSGYYYDYYNKTEGEDAEDKKIEVAAASGKSNPEIKSKF